jgi:TusA-related sulfurtransferase
MTTGKKHFLDLTADVCPMTFVKTRLLIEGMSSGESAEIRLVGQEPIENVPASLRELGHTVLNIEPEEKAATSGYDIVHLLTLYKN